MSAYNICELKGDLGTVNASAYFNMTYFSKAAKVQQDDLQMTHSKILIFHS